VRKYFLVDLLVVLNYGGLNILFLLQYAVIYKNVFALKFTTYSAAMLNSTYHKPVKMSYNLNIIIQFILESDVDAPSGS